MNYNSATKNEIKLFAGKGNGTGDYHEENIPSRQSHVFTNTQNLTYKQ
jgi:hypothetical protein